jgi:hypothetical protein
MAGSIHAVRTGRNLAAGSDEEEDEGIKAKTVDQLFQELDTNHDGMIDADEFAAMDANKDGRIDVADMTDHPSDYISVSRLQTELAFRDEKRTACQAATLFMLFNVIGYQLIVDNHFKQEDAYGLTQSLTSFVEGVDAGQPGASLTIADVGDGVGILDWVHSGLIDSIFGDVKYNDEKMALWERNYVGRYNKVIGGVFLSQHRFLRADPQSPSKGTCTDLVGDEYDSCLKEHRLCGSDKFYSFYPVCHIDYDPNSKDETGVPVAYGPDAPAQGGGEDARFKESVVTQAALGEGTSTTEMCTQLARDNDGRACIACLKERHIAGAPTFMIYDDTPGTDCDTCKEQCLKIVAPVLPDQSMVSTYNQLQTGVREKEREETKGESVTKSRR